MHTRFTAAGRACCWRGAQANERLWTWWFDTLGEGCLHGPNCSAKLRGEPCYHGSRTYFKHMVKGGCGWARACTWEEGGRCSKQSECSPGACAGHTREPALLICPVPG